MNPKLQIFALALLIIPSFSNAMLKAKVIKAVGVTAVASSTYAGFKMRSNSPNQFTRQTNQQIRDPRLVEQYRREYAQQTNVRLSSR